MCTSRTFQLTRSLPALVLAGLLAACGSDATTGPPPPEPPPEATTGTIEASAATTGEDPDPDGYTLTLDGGESLELAPDGTVTFEEVEEGDHELALSGTTDNCPVDGENPRSVTVVEGETASTTFDLACTRADLFAFSSDRSGVQKVWAMRTDGSHPVRLTDGAATDGFGAWSPDGDRIAFLRQDGAADDEIWVMNSDGSDPAQLVAAPFLRAPRWSPDGTRIAFLRGLDLSSHDIWVMDADGSNATDLTQQPANYSSHPEWSSDGSQILFERSLTIWIMNSDGSNPTNLSAGVDPDRDRRPSWSPDESRIAFYRLQALWVMDADGTNRTQLVADNVELRPIRWSPDGSRIAFVQSDGAAIRAVNPDGSNETELAQGPISGGARWSPDGARIAFARSDETGVNFNIWVMEPDGSNQTQITDAEGFSGGPRWRP